MNLEELFTGIGIVIDDNVNASDSDDRIVKIVRYLEEECHIPLVKYEDVPDIDILIHCRSINFILVDWSLLNLSIGVNSAELEKESHERILNFLKEVQTKSFAPVFLFSNEDISSIQSQVKRVAGRLPILFKSKSEIVDSNNKVLFWEALEEWFNAKSSVYVQKKWNASFEKARVDFMLSLNRNNQHWPKVICQSAKSDSTNPSVEINNIIIQNLLSRMDPIEFDIDQIERDTNVVTPQDLVPILESQRFCPVEHISGDHTTGDFYEKDDKFWINIRPACDCVPRDNFDGLLYLLECVPHGKTKGFEKDYGNHSEKDNEVIIGPLFRNRYFSVQLKKLKICNVSEFTKFRKGRIQHPFITRIVQKFGLYIQRQGLPRIPLEAIYSQKEIDDMKIPKSDI